MDTDPHGLPAQGLALYLRSVAREVQVPFRAVEVELSCPAFGYITLDQRAPTFPDYNLGLMWDEENGWAVMLEDPDALIVLTYLGNDVLLSPVTVAALTAELLAGAQPGQPDSPQFRLATDADDLDERLSEYLTRG